MYICTYRAGAHSPAGPALARLLITINCQLHLIVALAFAMAVSLGLFCCLTL